MSPPYQRLLTGGQQLATVLLTSGQQAHREVCRMDQRVSSPPAPPRANDLEGLLGRRVLAWSGAGAIALGLAFLVAIAVDRGLLGPSARVTIAACVSGLLVGVGGWVYERHGRT